MSKSKKILLIVGGIILLAIIGKLMGIKSKDTTPKLEQLVYSVTNTGEYGVAAEPGYKLTLVVDHQKWTKSDLLETAITEIKAIPNNYKYKSFTVFVSDTNSKFHNLSIYKMETSEKLYKLEPESFTFEELASEADKSLSRERK